MRGEVHRVLIPSPVARGAIQSNPRPAIVVSSDTTNTAVETVLVVVGTTNQKAAQIPGCVKVSPERANGLSRDTYFLCHQVQVVNKGQLTTRLGRLAAPDLAAVETALRTVLGL